MAKIIFGGFPENGQEYYNVMFIANDGFVYWQLGHYDHEDNRAYQNEGKFNHKDMKKAILELKEKGRSEIKGIDSEMSLRLDPKKWFKERTVNMIMRDSPYPSSTPGGAFMTSSIDMTCRLSTLELILE